MKQKKADIITVSKAARVSPSTVSRFFNHPELLKVATRAKIENAVKRTGYIRNRAAQTIHGIRSGTIGVLVPTLDHAIFAEVVQAFSEAVTKEGFTILLASHGYDLKTEYAILRKFLEHRVDGVVLTGMDHDEAVFQLIDSQEIPCVFMWNYSEREGYTSIGSDNALAGRMITEHILSLGHADIACMFPPTNGNDRALERRESVLATLAAAGISVPENRMLETVYSISASKRDAVDLFSSTSKPTALICGNDILATGALFGAAKCKLDVPKDVSIVGIGDFKGSSDFEPAITTVRLPAKQIGARAGEALVQKIVGGNPEGARSVHCLPELQVRHSSGFARGSGSNEEEALA